MRSSDFTDRHDDVLRQVRDSEKSPTVRELAEHFDVAPATMHSWLSKLKTEGLVAWETGRHRSLRLTRKGAKELASPKATPESSSPEAASV